MDKPDFVYSCPTRKGFEEAAVAVLASVEKQGWAVFSVYDLHERLAAKGFSHRRLKVIEICNARHSDSILKQDALASLCMPCRINVIETEEGTVIAGMRPSVMASIFPAVRKEAAAAVEKDLLAIIQASA